MGSNYLNVTWSNSEKMFANFNLQCQRDIEIPFHVGNFAAVGFFLPSLDRDMNYQILLMKFAVFLVLKSTDKKY